MLKEIKLSKIIVFVLLLTMIATILVSDTYSRFTTTASGSDSVVVAKWAFEVNGEDIAVTGDAKTIEFGLFDTIYDSDGETKETNVADGYIAPGTSGSFEFALQNTSEVTAQYGIEFEVTNTNNIPIEYSTDGSTWTNTLEDIIASEETTLAIGQETKNVVIKWRWAFDGDTDADTTIGSIAGEATDDAGIPNITVKATVNAIQVSSSGLLDEYVGKKVSILGDSISTLKGYIPETNRPRYVQTNEEAVDGLLYMPYKKTWWGGVIESLDMTLGVNDSWAGSLVSNTQTTDSGDKGPNRHMASMTRLQKLDDNGTPDVIFFYGGTNDIFNNITLGTFNKNLKLNTTQTEYTTFAEAYTMAILRMQSLYPNAEIISLGPVNTPLYASSKVESMNLLIEEICDYYDVKYIDLRESGITTTTADLADQIHPTENGMKLFTTHIIRELSQKDVVNDEEEGNDGSEITGERTTKNSHAVQLPNDLTTTTNLYKELPHESGYYTADGTFGLLPGYEGVISMTIPVLPGDKLSANSMKSKTENNTTDGASDGVRITYLFDDEVVVTYGSAAIYNEYKINGYITVPEGANAVCIAWWQESEDNFLYILSADKSDEEPEEELEEKINYYKISEKYDKYYDIDGNWTINSGGKSIVSIIVDVEPGDKLKSNSFGNKNTNGSDGHADGIRISFLLDETIKSSMSPAEVYSEYSTKGFVTVPDGVNKANITWWSESENNYLYIE